MVSNVFFCCVTVKTIYTLHLVFVSSCLYFPACPVIRISGSQPLSGIASRSSPNCWMCFFGWSRCTMLVVRQIVVKEKRNFCWCWFSLVVDSRHTSNVDYCINRWSWTDFTVDVEKKCWAADWLLALVVILIRWILHHSAYHTLEDGIIKVNSLLILSLVFI